MNLRSIAFRQARAVRHAVAACLLVSGGMASAQNATPAEWQYELTPYLWAARMNGDVKVGPLPKTTLDMKFSDILSTLDFGFMSAFEARKGQWGLLFDGMYMKNSDSASASRSGAPTVDAKMKLRQTMLSAAMFYRVSDGEAPVDIIAGLRYNNIDSDAKINAAINGLTGTIKEEGRKHWTDPYIGIRARYPIAERWAATAYGDIGGFNVGSDRTWQASLGLSYAISKTASANFGYRYLKTDYDEGGFLYDMRNDGVYGGVSFRF